MVSAIIWNRKCRSNNSSVTRAGLLRAEAGKNELSSVTSLIATSLWNQQQHKTECLKLPEMFFFFMIKPNITVQKTPSVSWSGVIHTDAGLWSSGIVFSVVMNHTSLSGSLMDESSFW